MKIQRALLSVSDKKNIVELARFLHKSGVELLSTGGTAALLRQEGLTVIDVATCTGFPEMLDGRIKTLHPHIHGGILARRDLPEHMATLQAHDIKSIDLVVVNLYPFEKTVQKEDVSLAEIIENIDIGGPAMVRAAAKNFTGVAVTTNPEDYSDIIEELSNNQGCLSNDTRYRLAVAAFTHSARYDSAIANTLSSRRLDGSAPQTFPEKLQLAFDKAEDLRYGENPHQQAAFYRDRHPAPNTLAHYQQLQGKPLSYNNLADADAAWECVKAFDQHACVIVKHANPCGISISKSAADAYQRAFATDPISSFGGIIACNSTINLEAAEAISQQFLEVLIAPEFTPEALTIFAKKPNIRILQCTLAQEGALQLDYKRIGGGLLVQHMDSFNPTELRNIKVVSKRPPDENELRDLYFAWRAVQFIKSNAIVFCRDLVTLGIGAGQMSRVDSTQIAAIKAQTAALSLAGSVVASDAFFPFRDGIDKLAEAGARAVIQPGGSIRDEEVIQAANEHGIAMLFTGVRHFRH